MGQSGYGDTALNRTTMEEYKEELAELNARFEDMEERLSNLSTILAGNQLK